MWYLTKKKYITRADNGEATLTVDGVDFIESQRTNLPILDKLLTSKAGESDAHCLPATGAPSPESTPDGWELPVEAAAAGMSAQL